MKSIKLIALLLSFAFLVACSSDDEVPSQIDIPSNFSVDIPQSISDNAGGLNGRVSGDGDGMIEGNEIYESLRGFIKIGEGSAEIIELTLLVGVALEVQNVRSYTFESEDDGREKRIDITEGVTRGGTAYDYEMTMVDTENDEMALQLLWNTDPVQGVGILKPYNIDRTEHTDAIDAFVRIDYSEDDATYDATMTVSIAGLETPQNGDIDNLKMFVGKKGDIVDVMGNSNHPNIVIIDEDFTGGRNYAFVARGDESTDLGVAKLALPPSATTTDDVLVDYSVYAVLDAEIKKLGITDQDLIDEYLAEALSPAYFNNDGFITSGPDNKPVSFSDEFVDLTGMNPFVPNDVKNLTLDFIK
jgi:signal peptidase I